MSRDARTVAANPGAQNAALPGAEVAGAFVHDGSRYEIERIRFLGPRAGHEPVRIGIFSGIHGDEPAGTAALRLFLSSLLRDPARATGYEVFAYPTVNPVGMERGTRENCAGMDLNREFWRASRQPEILIIEDELRRHRFNGLIALHADDSCEGTYGYSHGNAMEDSLLRPALLAAGEVLPRDRRASIDGFHAHEGIICDCFPGILAPPPDQHPRPFNLIFETPATVPLDLQAAAHVAALDAILATYRGYISYAKDL
jgi:murein peptide amidase A